MMATKGEWTKPMRRLILLGAVVFLAWSHVARAAAPTLTVRASPQQGGAPLVVTLSASGDPATYAWDLGDGTTAIGPLVPHTYEQAGTYTATVTARSADGESSQASVEVTAYALALQA